MRRYTFFSVLCSILFFSANLIHGQGFTGPGSVGRPVMISRSVPVSEARNLPNDSWVVLTGNIVNALPGGVKYYTFRDSSGEIPVEIDLKVWRGMSVGTSDRIEISGEVKLKNGQVRIKVKAIAPPGETNTRYAATVGAARTLPHDSWVIITGNVTNALGGKDYLFRDSSGEITVKIDPKVWRGLSVSAADRVEISGEVKIKKGQVSIDVKAVRGV